MFSRFIHYWNRSEPCLNFFLICIFSVCLSVTLAALLLRAPLMTTSLLYMHETVIGCKLLGTGIHLLKIKWWSHKICFRAFMDVFLCAFHGKQEHRFLFIIRAWDGYVQYCCGYILRVSLKTSFLQLKPPGIRLLLCYHFCVIHILIMQSNFQRRLKYCIFH